MPKQITENMVNHTYEVDIQENPQVLKEIIEAFPHCHIRAVNIKKGGEERSWYFEPLSNEFLTSTSGKNNRPLVNSSTSVLVYDLHAKNKTTGLPSPDYRRYTHSTTQYLFIEELGLAFVPKCIKEMHK